MSKPAPPLHNKLLLYQTADGRVRLDVRVEGETVWLTQKMIAELFAKDVRTINEHIQNVFEEQELVADSVIRNFRITASDGKSYDVQHYNLDVIIAVGYRAKSPQATQFRIWATQVLREFIIKGFAMNDERLKQGKQVFGKDYFEELLERIREIRASERRFYQKITDLYALSVDYSKDAPLTRDFFATVQNKLHWAITGQTAAEIIYSTADATKLFMGLSTWKHAPAGKILKSDVTVAKNYLNEQHVKALNRLVSTYCDLAENRAERQIPMKMQDWVRLLHDLLEISNYPILQDNGKVSALEAKLKAEQEYDVYRQSQDAGYVSDFDREVLRLMGQKP